MLDRRWFLYAVAALCCCSSISCSDPNAVDIQGAGATFPAPLYKRWFLEYYKANPSVRVNYQAIGSGAGIRRFAAGELQFGGSDAAMSKKEIEEAEKANPGRGVLLLPMTAGSIAIAYNVPGVPEDVHLKLTAPVYVDLFLGKITHWNDPAIAAANPDVALPDLPVTVVRRADGSGTTYVFTNHLAEVSAEWKKKPGAGKSVEWPVGIGGKGNAGVAALIQQTPGAVGYLETGFAELLKIPMAQLQNAAKQFVAPSKESGVAALAEGKLSDYPVMWVRNPKAKEAYPIVTYTWMMTFKKYDDAKQAEELKKVLRFCLATDGGQQYSEKLGYLPLPDKVRELAVEAIKEINK